MSLKSQGGNVRYNLLVTTFILTGMFSVFASDLLDEIVRNTIIEGVNIEKLEGQRNLIKGNSLLDIINRTKLDEEISRQKQLRAKTVLEMAIKSTDVSNINSEISLDQTRLKKRTVDLGSDVLNKMVDETVVRSNPALASMKHMPNGRPLVLGRDVDMDNLYHARNPLKKSETMIVEKTNDLRGRTVYKSLDGKVVDYTPIGKVFDKSDVIYRDESGKLQKGYPKAIYSDGTLEFKDQHGFTQRRMAGSYHLSDDIASVNGEKIKMNSQRIVSVYDDLDGDKSISTREKNALKSLRRVMCNL